jgi:hypothetical protein
MRLHPSTVRRLMKIYDTYGGHREEIKLRQELEKLDLSVYQQQSPPHREVLVSTDELEKAIRNL